MTTSSSRSRNYLQAVCESFGPGEGLQLTQESWERLRGHILSVLLSEMAQGSALNGDKGQQNGLLSPTTPRQLSPLLQRAMRIQALVLRGIPAPVARAMVDGKFRGPYG